MAVDWVFASLSFYIQLFYMTRNTDMSEQQRDQQKQQQQKNEYVYK